EEEEICVMDIVLENAVLPNRPERWSIGIEGEQIAAVTQDKLDGRRRVDLDGLVVSPSFVDVHTHIDKCFTADRTPGIARELDLRSAITLIRQSKDTFSVDDVARRASKALDWGLAAGIGAIRTHVDVDPFVQLRSVEAINEVRRRYGDRLSLQMVAHPQEGWFDAGDGFESGSRETVCQAMQAGADVVGGNVNATLWPSSPEAQVDEIFAFAKEFDAAIDIHLDNADTSAAFTLPYVIQKTIETGWQGRVAVSHIASLAAVPDAQAADTIDKLREADVAVMVQPTRIRLTRVEEMLEAGVLVAVGTDNLRDAFVRHGRANPIRILLLLAQLIRRTTDADLERLWLTITDDAARAIGISDYGIHEGAPANLVVLDAGSIPHAVLHEAEPRLLLFRGAPVLDTGLLQ